jgi:hypothetical protein
MNKSKKKKKKNLFKKNSKLTDIEKRYCRCLVKVKDKKPYGICTSSVYNKQGLKRNKIIKCSKNYNFKNFDYELLRSYAQKKKIKTSKKNLLKRILNSKK